MLHRVCFVHLHVTTMHTSALGGLAENILSGDFFVGNQAFPMRQAGQRPDREVKRVHAGVNAARHLAVGGARQRYLRDRLVQANSPFIIDIHKLLASLPIQLLTSRLQTSGLLHKCAAFTHRC